MAENKESNGVSPTEFPSLQQVQTAGSITITPEMFERMYLAPQNQVKGDLRKMVGNPTPVGLGGFLIAYTPLIIELMGWRGADGGGAALVGTFYFFGGLLAILACVGEWIIGNTFPSTFFGVYGGFFFYYGATLTPYYGAAAAYDPNALKDGQGNPLIGAMEPGFMANTGFVTIFMALFSLYCAICSLRINIIFFTVFALLTVAFCLYTAAQWYGAQGYMDLYSRYTVAAGAVGFVVGVEGWYLLLAIMLTTVDFPLELPVGDLSTLIKSGTELRRSKNAHNKASTNGAA